MTKRCENIADYKRRSFRRILIDGPLISGWCLTLVFSNMYFYDELKGGGSDTKKSAIVIKKILSVLNLAFSFLATVYVFRFQNLIMNALVGIALTSALLQLDLAFSKKKYKDSDTIIAFVFIINTALIVSAVGYVLGVIDDYDIVESDYARLCAPIKKDKPKGSKRK